jgi:hypothetical protein
MQTIPGGVNSWYVDSVVVSKRVRTFLGKLTIYYSFILSNFNYCPLVWHFCGESNTKKLEKIQERALRFIYNNSDSSYENFYSHGT